MAKSITITNGKKITTTLLEEAGIRTILTQNDVIELIAQEKYNVILGEINGSDENFKGLDHMVTELKNEQKEILIHELIVQGMISREQASTLILQYAQFQYNNNTVIEYIEFGQLRIEEYRKKKVLAVSPFRGYTLLNDKSILAVTLELSFSKEDKTTYKGITVHNTVFEKTLFKKEIKLPNAFIKRFNQALETHCLKVKELFFRYKEMEFDLDKIIRETKTKFNKEILKSQAPDIKKKIEELFQVKL